MSTAAALVAAAGPAAPALRPVITGPTDTAVAREDQRTLRGKLFQILWHADPLTGVNRALHSVDCHPTEPVFALCSIDKEFSLWRLKPTPTTSGTPGATSTLATPAIAPASGVRTDVARHADVEVEHIAKVEGHDASVNVVRFSPNGEGDVCCTPRVGSAPRRRRAVLAALMRVARLRTRSPTNLFRLSQASASRRLATVR